MVSSHEETAMSLFLSGNSSEYAGNMSCVTLHRELHALCENASMAETDECNKGAQGINLAVPITMTAFGVLGNILALVVLYTSRQEAQARRTVFFVMLSGLAWTDLVCQVAVSPIAIITYANKLRWVGGKPLCLYHGFMMVSFGMVMPLIICCMSLERLLAIKFSYCYTRRVTHRKALMTFLACWGVTLAFTALPFVGVGSYELQYPGSWCFLNFHRESRLDAIYAGVFSSINILAILTMIVSNLTVAGTLCRMRFSRRLANSPSLDRKLSLSGQFTPSSTTCTPGTVIRGKRHSDMEAQMIWFLGMITVAFSVCWLPLNVHILLMQFTGYTNCVLDLKVIRMASSNQILDPWLYVIFRKNSILRIVRRIRACFCPNNEPPRAVPAPHRTHYMMENRSYTVDGTTFGRTLGKRQLCKHLILGGADLIGGGGREDRFIGSPLGGSKTDILCSQCSLSDDNDGADNIGQDPLIHLRLGDSPTSSPANLDKGRFSFDSSSKSGVEAEEDSTHETELFSDRIKSDLSSCGKARSLDEKNDSVKSLLSKSKAEENSSGAKEKLRWFLPGLNSTAGDAFASYESTDTSSFPAVRPPSIKSPHPIYKQKIHPSRSFMSQMTPGFSPADFLRGTSASTNQSAFIFPPPAQSAQDISSQPSLAPETKDKHPTAELQRASSHSKSDLENGNGEQCIFPHSNQFAKPALLSKNVEPVDCCKSTNLLSERSPDKMSKKSVNEDSMSPLEPPKTVQWKQNDVACSVTNSKRPKFPTSLQSLPEDTNIVKNIANKQNKNSLLTPSSSYINSHQYKKAGSTGAPFPLRENVQNYHDCLKEKEDCIYDVITPKATLVSRRHDAVSNSKVGKKTSFQKFRDVSKDFTDKQDTNKPLLSAKSSSCSESPEHLHCAKPVSLSSTKTSYSISRTTNGSTPRTNGVYGEGKHTQV